MRKTLYLALLVLWTFALSVWTLSLIAREKGISTVGLLLHRGSAPDGGIELQELKGARLASGRKASAQVLALAKQSHALADFIATEPSANNRKDALALLASTNRQATLAIASTQNLGLEWKAVGPARPGQFPYQVSIVLSKAVPYADQGYRCGGVLISSSWVLTAGHCFQYDSEPIDVEVFWGHVNLSDSHLPNCNCWSTVAQLVRSPNYAEVQTAYGPVLDGDVALLKLANPATGPGVGWIQPAQLSTEPSLLNSGPGIIAGWGKTSDNPGSLSDALLYGTVKITADPFCAKSYGSGIIKPDMVCAAPHPTDACSGDSGSPLILTVQSTPGTMGTPYLEGITSWTYPPGGCPSTKPTVYSRVAAFSNWINQCVTGGPCPSSIPKT